VIDLKGDEGGEFQLKFTINPPIQCGDVNAPPVWDADMDLITWLQDQARALAAKCGIRPDTLILGSQAASIFASNKSVQAERNLMAYTQMTAPQYQDAAVTFLGRYAGLDVFEYNGVYIVGDANNQDVAQDFLTPATAILACSQAAGTMTYGAISLVEDEGIAIYAAERVADSFANKGGGTWTQRVSSRYAPCPGDSSSWQTFTVVAPAP
jgi:hypothetical protein